MSTDPLSAHVRAGWTWIGPTAVGDPSAPDHYELRIQELRDFLVAGTTLEELYAELRPALRAFFSSYQQRGEPLPPLPPKWIVTVRPRYRRPVASYTIIAPRKASSGVDEVPYVLDEQTTP